MVGGAKTILALTFILSIPAPLAVADCRGIDDAATWADGTWLFRTNNDWRPVNELTPVARRGHFRPVTFAYIANEPALKSTRRGLLVIKSGVDGPYAKNPGYVRLRREAFAELKSDEKCEAYPAFDGGSVRIKSYDLYHDRSERSDQTDEKMLNSFHVTYLARVKGCKRSNDNTKEIFLLRRRSNISDFSFDPRVVADGQYSQFIAQFGFSPAYAEPRAERRVELKRYMTDENGLACVTFRLAMKPGTYIRINDLERRIGLWRAGEQSWTWPQ